MSVLLYRKLIGAYANYYINSGNIYNLKFLYANWVDTT